MRFLLVLTGLVLLIAAMIGAAVLIALDSVPDFPAETGFDEAPAERSTSTPEFGSKQDPPSPDSTSSSRGTQIKKHDTAVAPEPSGHAIRLIAAPTKTPLRKMRILVNGEQLVTDEDGEFVHQADGILKMHARGYASQEVRLEFGSEPVLPSESLEVVLYPVAKLSCTVVDPGGTPLAEADVCLRAHRRDVFPHMTRETWFPGIVSCTTNSQGSAVVRSLPACTSIEVWLTFSGALTLMEESPLLLAPGELRHVRWVMPAWGCLRGRVQDEFGKPLKRAEICLSKPPSTVRFPSVRVNENGEYCFPRLFCGQYELHISPPNGREQKSAFASKPEPVNIAHHNATVRKTSTVYRELAIRGTVAAEDGASLGGVAVTAYHSSVATPNLLNSTESWAVVRTVSRPSGAFELSPVMPGSYWIVAAPGGKHFALEPIRARSGSQSVMLRVGIGGSIAGEVSWNQDTKPGAINVIATLRGQAQASSSLTWKSGSRHKFRFDGLVPGLYDLYAYSARGTLAGSVKSIRVSARSSNQRCRISMELGGAATVTCPPNVKDRIGDDIIGLHYRCTVYDGETIVRPEERVNPGFKIVLPPGQYQLLTKEAEGDRATKTTIVVVAGATANVVAPW